MREGILAVGTIGLALTVLTGALPLEAHHSLVSEYDINKPVTLTGVVKSVEIKNPHSHIFLEVDAGAGVDLENQTGDGGGEPVVWDLEGFPPQRLARSGWQRGEEPQPGERITVTGWQARDGEPKAHAYRITLADGTRLDFGVGTVARRGAGRGRR